MTELEHKKQCACRKVWAVRDKFTPKAIQYDEKYTWSDWFLQMFGEPIEDVYRRQLEGAAS